MIDVAFLERTYQFQRCLCLRILCIMPLFKPRIQGTQACHSHVDRMRISGMLAMNQVGRPVEDRGVLYDMQPVFREIIGNIGTRHVGLTLAGIEILQGDLSVSDVNSRGRELW